MKQLKNFTLHLLAGANVTTIVAMLAVGYSGCVNPAQHRLVGIIGLSFPAFLVANLAFLLFWLCVRKRWALIPLAGFVLGYAPVRAYCPLNIPRTAPEGCIKVLAYNTLSWGNWKADDPCPTVAQYIHDQDADIVCLEEANIPPPRCQLQLDSLLSPLYAYSDTALSAEKSDAIWLMSKYPIVKKEKIVYPSKSNHSAAFWLKRGQDTIIVVANHLQSTSLTNEERQRFRSMVHGDMADTSPRAEGHTLYTKLGEATAMRAPQVDAVVDYVRRHSRHPVIVCGDMNDSPISYTRHRLAQVLTDCYAATANGPGISYHYNAFYVRIDHMFASSHFQPYGCRVDRSISASDHYPLLCWLKLH